MNTVATNLLGRWVRGSYIYHNPDYVWPEGSFPSTYTRKQLKTLTEVQKAYWTVLRTEGQVVAVTSKGEAEYTELVFWILIDGKTRPLDNVTVMPAEWTPAPTR